MVEVRLRKAAKRDLSEIGRYTIEHWSEAKATTYLDELLDVIDQIGEHPFFGESLQDVRAGYRRRRAGHHLIFYVVTEVGTVEIARVLHERVDVQRHLEKKT